MVVYLHRERLEMRPPAHGLFTSCEQLLNKMRQGTVDKEMLKVFESLDRPLHFTDGIEATHLSKVLRFRSPRGYTH